MAPVPNTVVIFNDIPTTYPEPGKTLKKIEEKIDLDAPLKPGQVLTKVLTLSLDPYMRGRMRPAHVKSYAPPFLLGQPIENFGVGEVLNSEHPKWKKGDHVYGYFKFKQYVVFDKDEADKLTDLPNTEKLPWTTWVGAAGMPGQTAWYGLREIGKPQKGETIFVSGGAGAVGQMVIAICHHHGLKVLASAGSDEKVEYLKKELKVEVAWNYKKVDTEKILEENPFELYWDNVGGPTFEAVLNTIKVDGRIIACGAISEYNGQPYGVKNLYQLFAHEIFIKGFLILNKDVTQFYKEVPKWIAEGTLLTPKEHIFKGLDDGASLLALYKGGNMGKAVISLE
ncbi:hypothetical protein JCM21900_006617 [Sporobolomyces salmonicolor]